MPGPLDKFHLARLFGFRPNAFGHYFLRHREGQQPRLGSMIVEDYIRPAAIAAGVLEERRGKFYYDGELVILFGFHNLRHGLATWLAEQGKDPMVIQRMLRHTTDMTAHYIHAKSA